MVSIMKDVSQIAGDLVQCQAVQLGRLYRRTLTKILAWLLIVLVSILLAIGGLGMILLGVHLRLSMITGAIGSAYIIGGFLLLLAVIIFLIGRNMLKD